MATIPPYAELRCLSNFSFLRGASRPEELIERARQLGYSAIALTDECSLAGVVRAHTAAKEHGIRLLIGAQFLVRCDAPFDLVVLATSLEGYGHLSQFITKLRRSSDKGSYRLDLDNLDAQELTECLVIAVPQRGGTQEQTDQIGRWLLSNFTGRAWLGVEQLRRFDDDLVLHQLQQTSELTAIPLVAVGDVNMHVRSRKPLHDVMTAIRLGKTLRECGLDLQETGERHLRPRVRIANAHHADLEMMAETLRIADRCRFSLDEIRYEYPHEVVPEGETAAEYLRRITYEGAGRRWPAGVPAKVHDQIEHELELISELKYESYFLTVYDVVAFARSRRILCQGRGSAANSAVCYCLFVTEVDPSRASVLFERFISRERAEPPDIDIDFEHERREEVMQYLYARYGRDRAALTAAVATYGPRSAIQDVGKALGLDPDQLQAVAKEHKWWDGSEIDPQRLVDGGLVASKRAVTQLMSLTAQILRMPRHLSQHSGGFVLSNSLLSRIVPIENATMQDRTVIEWDKDDIDVVGLMKVDILALGMLTAIRKCLDLISAKLGYQFEMQDITPEDPETYDMICRSDTCGVFQVESRAQRNQLPTHQPRCFYDLVVQVAIVRPGPIQGGSVHPYLRRRQGLEAVTYPSELLREALERTLGVPIFQEQVMQIAKIGAGYTAGESDQLRRDMAAWKRTGNLARHEEKLIAGLLKTGHTPEFARAIFEQVKGFSSYGFPESHAASFALIVYASCWLKRHHPAEFLCALLNSQPLGFYTPDQLIQDGRRHGVDVRAVDVMHSNFDCTIEPGHELPAIRLGMRMVKSLKRESVDRIVEARDVAPFTDTGDLARRALIDLAEMKHLAAASALKSLSGHRRQQVWDAAAERAMPPLLRGVPVDEDLVDLNAPPEGEDILWDYASIGLTLGRHPLALLRPMLARRKLRSAHQLYNVQNGRTVRHAGLVTLRQQPETASGVTFMTTEDETGEMQLIVWRGVLEQNRKVVLGARLLAVTGEWQSSGILRSLVVHEVEDLTHLLGRLGTSSRDFH